MHIFRSGSGQPHYAWAGEIRYRGRASGEGANGGIGRLFVVGRLARQSLTTFLATPLSLPLCFLSHLWYLCKSRSFRLDFCRFLSSFLTYKCLPPSMWVGSTALDGCLPLLAVRYL